MVEFSIDYIRSSLTGIICGRRSGTSRRETWRVRFRCTNLDWGVGECRGGASARRINQRLDNWSRRPRPARASHPLALIKDLLLFVLLIKAELYRFRGSNWYDCERLRSSNDRARPHRLGERRATAAWAPADSLNLALLFIYLRSADSPTRNKFDPIISVLITIFIINSLH